MWQAEHMVSATSAGAGKALQGMADASHAFTRLSLGQSPGHLASASPCCSRGMSKPLALGVAQFPMCEMGMTAWGCGVVIWSLNVGTGECQKPPTPWPSEKLGPFSARTSV